MEAAVELRHLRYFVAVAEAESISRAALKLHVSQPPLSRQIRDLENELGFLLLKRTAKSVSLTEAGRTFLNEARAVLQRADEGVKKARTVATAGETDLHVGDARLRRRLQSAENAIEKLEFELVLGVPQDRRHRRPCHLLRRPAGFRRALHQPTIRYIGRASPPRRTIRDPG